MAIDDVVSKILWTRRFIESQGFKVSANLVYRDNTSSMKLEMNGRASASKRTRHFNIKYFFITDLIERGEVEIKYCPTDDMLADYMTKPVVGTKFMDFRDMILNTTSASKDSRSVLADGVQTVGEQTKSSNSSHTNSLNGHPPYETHHD